RIVVLDVGQASLDVEEAVAALKAFIRDVPRMQTLAGLGGRGQGHRRCCGLRRMESGAVAARMRRKRLILRDATLPSQFCLSLGARACRAFSRWIRAPRVRAPSSSTKRVPFA